MNVASVNVWNGRAMIRTPWYGGRIAPGCLKKAVDIETIIISWMGSTTNGARQRGSGVFGTLYLSCSSPHLTQTNCRAQ